MHHLFAGEQGDHHTTLGQSAHQTPARGDQFDAIFQAKHPGNTGCGHFTDTMTDEESRLDPPRLPQLGQGHFQGKERGLGVGGVVKRAACYVLRVPCLVSPVSCLVSPLSALWIKHRQQ